MTHNGQGDPSLPAPGSPPEGEAFPPAWPPPGALPPETPHYPPAPDAQRYAPPPSYGPPPGAPYPYPSDQGAPAHGFPSDQGDLPYAPPSGPGGPDGAGWGAPPPQGFSDATQLIPPVFPGTPLPPESVPHGSDMDATRMIPPVGAADATQFIQPVGPGPFGAADATQLIPPMGPGADATRIIPPVGAGPLPAGTADATQIIPSTAPGALPPERGPGGGVRQGETAPPARHGRPTPPVPPQPTGAPYGIRPGAPGDRPPPAEFDNLFRTSTAPGPQQDALRQPSPAAPGAPGSRRRAAPGRRAESSGRRKGGGLPVAIAVVVGCAVLGLGVGALVSGGNDPDPAPDKQLSAPPPAPSESPAESSPEPPPEDPAKPQAKALDALLADSNDSRAAVIRSVADIRACRNLEQASADLRAAAEQRRSLVTRLTEIDVDKLPEHEDLSESLTEAWQASASADDHYAAWADQVNTKKGCKKGKARTTRHASLANRASGDATEAKQEASALWNPIASHHNLPHRPANQL